MSGEYSIIITGPRGVALDAVIDLGGLGKPTRLAVDDERLRELLVVTAICAGTVEGELLKASRGQPARVEVDA